MRTIKYFGTVVVCCLSLLLSNCNDNAGTSKPADLLAEKTVEDVFLEMHLIEATVRVNIFDRNKDDMQSWVRSEVAKTMRQHKTNYGQFTRSLNYYMSNNKISQKMLDNVVNRLVEMELKQCRQPNENKLNKNEVK